MSFVDKIKSISQKPMSLINMNSDTSSKYSKFTDEVSVSPTHGGSSHEMNTPLNNTKTPQYGITSTEASIINIQKTDDFNPQRGSVDPTKSGASKKPWRQNTFSDSTSTKAANKKLKKMMMANVGYRLSRRKELHNRRRKVADVMFLLGAAGVILMILLIEYNFYEQYKYQNPMKFSGRENYRKFEVWNKSQVSVFLKFSITLSTLILITLIFVYHRLDMQIYSIDNSIDDYRIAITPSRIALIVIECIICIIHPIPGTIILYMEPLKDDNDVVLTYNSSGMAGSSDNVITDSVPLDIILSVPMFARLYLLCRIVLLHSKLVTDAGSQSLGYLNRVNFNFRFVFKAFMTQCPEYVLSCLIILLFLIASWGIKACEYHVNAEKFGFLNSMWLVAITFLTVGYGDLYAKTYCGRTISVLSGLFGVFCTALLVAVISRKLEFSRAEKYVYQFVKEVELKKKLEFYAANVIREGWLLHRFKKKTPQQNTQGFTPHEIIRRQRKLLMNIQKLRNVKHSQRAFNDNAVNTLEIYRQQQENTAIMGQLFKITTNLDKKVNIIEDKLESLQINLQSIQDILMSTTFKQ